MGWAEPVPRPRERGIGPCGADVSFTGGGAEADAARRGAGILLELSAADRPSLAPSLPVAPVPPCPSSMVHTSDIVELELKSAGFEFALRKKEALLQVRTRS